MNKKAAVILVISAFILISGITGIVLWRLNQESQIPEPESQAGGGVGACCVPIEDGGTGCATGWRCVTGDECTFDTLYPRSGCDCSTNEEGDQTCVCPGSCVPLQDGEPPIVTEYNCGSTICEYPEVVVDEETPEGGANCRCLPCNDPSGESGCTTLPEKCEPVLPCPTGTEECEKGSSTDCVKLTNSQCVVYGQACNNPSYVFRYCRELPEEEKVACGETCTDDADCEESNNICEDNVCQLEENSCLGGEVAGDDCFCALPEDVPCGESCTDDTDCTDANNICLSGTCQLDSLECDSDEDLSTDKCSCVTDEVVCGEACTTNSDCTDANNECKNNKCQLIATACPTGEVLNESACGCKKVTTPTTGILNGSITSLGAIVGITLILIAAALIIDWRTSIKIEKTESEDHLRIIIENKNKLMKKKIISIRY